MKKLIFLILIAALRFGLSAEDYLDLNFFIEPKFNPVEANMVNFLVKNIKNDSIPQFHLFAGKILKSSRADSLALNLLNLIKPDLAAPTDYLLFADKIEFNLLMSNVKCDSVTILDRFILETDSMRIGFFSIYTPDWTVKNELPDHVEFNYHVFDQTKLIARELAEVTDYVILLSNLGKDIDSDLVKGLPIDAVISFDYQKKENGRLNSGRTSFFSILTSQGKFGKLRLTFREGRISHRWMEMEFHVKS